MREQKRKAAADAKKAGAEAEQAANQTDQNKTDWVLEKVNQLDYYYKRSNRQIDGLTKLITNLISIIKSNDIFFCEDVSCPLRKPPLGQHHSTLPPKAEDAKDDEVKQDDDKTGANVDADRTSDQLSSDELLSKI